MSSKGKVIALCGKVASGKTYYANKLKNHENAIILSVDELTFYLFDNRDGENYVDLTQRAINYFMAKSVELAEKGINIILDIGLWQSSARKQLRDFYTNNGIDCEIHYIDIDDESWENNIENRNKRIEAGNKGTDFYVTASMKKTVLSLWEKPSKDEIDVWYEFKRED